jgi:heme-degrading monooxygenase HmoA
MFSVIFEVHPRREKFDLYLDLAKGSKPILEGIDGFIDNERSRVRAARAGSCHTRHGATKSPS